MRDLELKVSRTNWTPGTMFLVTMFASIATGCDSGNGTKLGQADGEGGADIGPATCSTAAECPTPANPCEVAACVANVCGGVPAPAGTFVPAEAQVIGDCKEFTCGEGGALTTRAAPNDLPADDGNPCTSEVCDGPNPTHPALEVGTACGEEGVCNAAAVCAECLPGAVGCDGDVPRSCDVDGAWVSEAACPFVCQGAAVCAGECKPGARDCSGRQPRVCNDVGTWQNEGDICAFACTAGACAGSCLPGAIQCNGQVPQSCDAAGAWQPSEACPFACVDGLCTGLCRPGANRCQGVVAQSCDANGTWTTTNTCPYLCQNGACGGVCAPGGKRCVGRTSQDCDANGQWADSQTCAFACSAGLCTGVCQPGATRCNNNQAQVCDSQGQWQTSEACTFACLGTGTCGGVCTPNASRCNGNNAEVCDSNGQWGATACTFACQNGGCTGICNPADKRCNSNNSQTCSASGQWTTTQTCPFVCSGAGTCSGQCAPSTTRCSGTTPQSCDGAGNWSSLTDCTFACVNGGCTGVCRPGEKRCLGTASQTCDTTGQWTTTQTCPFLCSGAGTCSGVCTPGTLQCANNTPQTCTEVGQWSGSTACSGSTPVCVSGMCSSQLCSPNAATSECVSLTARQVCTSDGLGFTSAACASGQSCQTGVCAVRCGDGIVGAGETCDDGNTRSDDGCSATCEVERCHSMDFTAGGYAQVARAPALDMGTSWSVSFWAWARVVGASGSVWQDGHEGVACPSYAVAWNAALSYYANSGGGSGNCGGTRLLTPNSLGASSSGAVLTGYTLPTGVWTHVAVVVSGTSGRTYANGALVHSVTVASVNPYTPAYDFRVGNYLSTVARSSFDGYLADMAVWRRALTDDEVSTLATGRADALRVDPELAVWLEGNEGSGMIVSDISGQGNSAALGGGARWAPSCPPR